MKMNKVLLFGSLICLIFEGFLTSADGCKGCVNLDEYNFNKIVPKFEAVLIKFDVAYPYGEKHEVFNSLATEIVHTKDFILAQVAVKDYGEKDNEEFSKKFGINSKEDLPALRLFVQGEDEPFAFEKHMPWNDENLKKFVREHTNIYLGLPGCIEKFDRLASKFSTDGDKEKILKQTQKEADLLKEEKDKEFAKTYIKIMKKILESGYTFVQQEDARINKVLAGKLNDRKRKELSYHQNVLRSFSIEQQKSEL